MKTKRILIAVAVILLFAVSAVWIRRGLARHDLALAVVPHSVDLASAHALLRSRLAEAEAQVSRRGQEIEGLAELSRIYHANGFLTEATLCYRGLEQLDPSEPRWPHRHATVLAGYGEIEPAILLWRRVGRLDRDYLPAQLHLADALLKINHPEEASQVYTEILRRQEDEPYSLFGLARIDFEAGRLEAARQRLERVVAATHFELGYDLIVTVYERLGQVDRAQQLRGTLRASGAYRDPTDPWMDVLLDDCFDPYRLALGAGLADRNGDSASAVRLLERATQMGPADVSARFQLGGLYARAGDLSAAAKAFTQCTTQAPDFADGWIHLSDVLQNLGDPTGATRVVLTGLEHCPDSPGLHLARARQLKQSRQFQAALDEFKSSIRLRPNEPEAYVELGRMEIENDQPDEGLRQLTLALKAEPENPTALGILAFHAITAGTEKEARAWLARVQHQPRVPPEQASKLLAAFAQAFGHRPEGASAQ